MILLWGLGTEPPLALVYEDLRRAGLATVFVDQRDVLGTEVRLSVGSEIRGSIVTSEESVDLGAVSAAYIRPYDSRLAPGVVRAGQHSAEWNHAAAVDEAISSWSEVTPALVVNRLGSMAVIGSKPYQLELIRRAGFSVPETLVTTDPQEAQAFWERHGVVIYKSVSGLRSIVSLLRLEHRGRLADVACCPTQFQRYIAGRDHRVHVVGDEVFASEVITDATDYRYPNGNRVQLRACRLDPELEERCLKVASVMRLPVAGVDLRLTPEGEWYCFEVNPSPAFSYYQAATEQPISAAIARLLASAPR